MELAPVLALTPTKYARIQSGLTYGGQGSYEFYMKFDAGQIGALYLRFQMSVFKLFSSSNPGHLFWHILEWK